MHRGFLGLRRVFCQFSSCGVDDCICTDVRPSPCNTTLNCPAVDILESISRFAISQQSSSKLL